MVDQREIGTLHTPDGDRWRCYFDGDGIWIEGSDAGDQRHPAIGHGLVLSPSERAWLAACVNIGEELQVRSGSR